MSVAASQASYRSADHPRSGVRRPYTSALVMVIVRLSNHSWPLAIQESDRPIVSDRRNVHNASKQRSLGAKRRVDRLDRDSGQLRNSVHRCPGIAPLDEEDASSLDDGTFGFLRLGAAVSRVIPAPSSALTNCTRLTRLR